jgi:hypothetical protein
MTNMLPWLVARYSQIPIIYLLRHPLAVAWSYSQLTWDDGLGHVLRQEPLMEDYLGAFRDKIFRQMFLSHIYRWCCENYVPINSLSPGSVHVVLYEDLLRNPNEELQRLGQYFSKFSEPWRSWRYSPNDLDRRSAADNRLTAPSNRIGEWRHGLPDSLIADALAVVADFGLDRVYGDDIQPKIMADRVLRSS